MKKFNAEQIVNIMVFKEKPVDTFTFKKCRKFLWWTRKAGMYNCEGKPFKEKDAEQFYIDENNICHMKPRLIIYFADASRYIKFYQKEEFELCINEAYEIMGLSGKWFNFDYQDL